MLKRQLLQRGEPFTSRLRRETRIQRWIHHNALARQPPPVLVFSLNSTVLI
ncbi:MAG: hypothetical protein V7K21_01780 [Nostoc sp.]|uniref:hypothetical protein n=1 Tax=Nostoc sp. TaxID=1180 RepID=UPI002FFCB902